LVKYINIVVKKQVGNIAQTIFERTFVLLFLVFKLIGHNASRYTPAL